MGNQKLSHSQVRLVRHLYRQGELSYRDLGTMFKVSTTQIYRIVNRNQHKQISDWVSDEDLKLRGKDALDEAHTDIPAERLPNRKYSLSDEQVDEIRERYEFDPVTMRALANEYGVSTMQICRIINNEQRKRRLGGS